MKHNTWNVDEALIRLYEYSRFPEDIKNPTIPRLEKLENWERFRKDIESIDYKRKYG